jgi:hypothetical protein
MVAFGLIPSLCVLNGLKNEMKFRSFPILREVRSLNIIIRSGLMSSLNRFSLVLISVDFICRGSVCFCCAFATENWASQNRP